MDWSNFARNAKANLTHLVFLKHGKRETFNSKGTSFFKNVIKTVFILQQTPTDITKGVCLHRGLNYCVTSRDVDRAVF